MKKWCNDNISSDFWQEINQYPPEYARISAWAASQVGRYSQNAIQEFLDADEADAFLVSFSLADLARRKIVTYEIPSNARNKIKIPDVCSAFGIQYVNPITMFRELGVSF